MKRRTLLAAISSGAAIALSGVTIATRTDWGHRAAVARAIRRGLPTFADLGTAPEDYAAAFVEAYHGAASGRELVLNFLLSTDFFLNGEDEARRVTFLALYDPLLNPCLVAVPRRQ